MISEEDFNFTQEELDILFWSKYWCVISEIGHSKNVNMVSRLFSKDEDIEEKEDAIKDLKIAWLVEWADILKQLLSITQEVEKESLVEKIIHLDLSPGKQAAFSVELSTFTPYYPLEEKSKKYKDLKFDEDIYLEEVTNFLEFKYAVVKKCRTSYSSALTNIAKKVSGSNNSWLWLGIGAAALLLVAPYLAGAIGGLMGLSGAAATSAGLAFLGGGSLAAGGFGMAGGYVAVMAGGAIFGYKSGSSGFQSRVQAATKEDLLISCSKVISVFNIVGTTDDEILKICESARLLQCDYEALSDNNFIGKELEQGKDNAKKAAILVAFRCYVRGEL